MSKKNQSEAVAKLVTALEKKKQRKPRSGGNPPPPPYRFKPGQSGNPAGRPPHTVYARVLSERMMRSCPPRELCEQIGVDPDCTWGEAILIVLGHTALGGDVAAAREVLSALGVSGTAAKTNVLVNVEQQTGQQFDFLRHAHGLSPEQLEEVWTFMDALPRTKTEIDASFYPDESYRESEPKQLTTAEEK